MRFISEYTIGVVLVSCRLSSVLQPFWLSPVQERLTDPLLGDPTCVFMVVEYPDYSDDVSKVHAFRANLRWCGSRPA